MTRFFAFFLFLIISFSLFGQTEKDEKRSHRKIKSETKTIIVEPRPTHRNVWFNPYFNGFNPYRRPYYPYIRNGNTDVIYNRNFNNRYIITLGLSYGFNNYLSGWIIVGDDDFFTFEYLGNIQRDMSEFYETITKEDVIRWNDEKLRGIVKGSIIYFGFGKKYNDIGLYFSIGYAWIDYREQYFDETYILSSNGRYSILDYEKNTFTGKVGIIYDMTPDFKVKTDYDPVMNILTLGFGFSF